MSVKELVSKDELKELEELVQGKVYSYLDYQALNKETGVFILDVNKLMNLTYASVKINHECNLISQDLSNEDFELSQLINDISSLSKSILKVFDTRFETEKVSYTMFLETDFDLVFLTYREKVKALNNSETNKLLSDMEKAVMEFKNSSVVILKG